MIRPIFLLSIALLSAAPEAWTQSSLDLVRVSEFVSAEYTGELPGSTQLSGWVVESVGATEYALSWVRTPRGDRLLFKRMLQRDSAGRPSWRVIAAFVPPASPKGHAFLGGLCEVSGRSDLNVVAVVRLTDTEWYTDVRRAWRLDPATATAIPVPAEKVRCANEGWGVQSSASAAD